jgi:hypothetical protein
VQVRLVPSNSWPAAHPDRITRVVREFFRAPVRVDVQSFDRLPLPPTGKLPVVVNELPTLESAPERGLATSGQA